MKELLKSATLACLLFLPARPLFAQLPQPVAPINLIIDSDMSNSVDDVGDHAVMWALANRGEVNVLAEICSSANDFGAPLMHAIASYYGHPDVPIGANSGSTPNLENSAVSNFTQQMAARFGIPGDTRANYPDPVTVYRRALAGAPDHSVYIVANGFWEPLQGLLQSPADSISPLTGLQLVTQKVVMLVAGAGFFPSGNEHNMRVDADAASFVYANWPVQIVNVGVEVSQDVLTGPDFSSTNTADPIKASYIQFNGGNPVPGFGQMPLLFAARGLAANFQVPGLNGQTTIESFSQSIPGQNNWFASPQVGDSFLAKQATTAQFEAILNPLLQGSSTMPILRSVSPSSIIAGGGAQAITLTGTNFFPDSQVQAGGASRATTFVSATQLTVQLNGSDVAQAGTLSLTVVNTEGLGWTSNSQSVTITPTTPSLTGISPVSALVGSGAVTLTATGTNFAPTSIVQVNGSGLSTTFVSSTQLSATIPTGNLSAPASLSITVSTPSAGTSSSLGFAVNNPVPSTTSLSPATIGAGSGPLTLTVDGSKFVSGSVVQVNGSNRTTTFASSTQLTAAIPAGDVASAGSLSIAVLNPAPGGGTSSSLTLSVNNALPALSSISPSSVTAGSGGFTLTASGSNFVSGSILQVNGSSQTTNFSSGTQLTATIPASDVASAGSLSIAVLNPAPGGGTSSSLNLAINNSGPNPQPTLSSLSPDSVIVGSGAFTLTLNGSNFVPSSVVQFNGSNRATTFVSSTQLTAGLSAADVATASFPSISVVSPAPGGGVWSLTFAVNNPLPDLSGLSPDSVIAGSGAFTLTLTGSNFIPSSVVQFNGSNRATTFVSSTQLTAAIPASDVATASFPSISVVNPGPGGGVWSLTFAVNNPLPTISSLSPESVAAGSGSFTLVINGSNFITSSAVQVNGSNRATTFVSKTQLTTTISGGDIASPADLSISVTNPGPGGGVWAMTLPVN